MPGTLHERLRLLGLGRTPRARRGASRFFITDGYIEREKPEYFLDVMADQLGLVHQPDVYPFAAHLARLYGCSYLIDLGCGRASKLVAFSSEFKLVGVDYGPNLEEARRLSPSGEWIEWDLERDEELPLPVEVSRGAILCADIIEHLQNPLPLLRNLRGLLDHAPFAVLSTPERDLAHGQGHVGPPANKHHVREWTLPELERLLQWAGFRVPFIGLTASHDDGYPKATILALLESPTGPIPERRCAPSEFRVVALMPTFNEEDVIEQSVQALVDDGVEVYVIDNWSTDKTLPIIERFLGRGVAGVERFPPSGPSPRYEWKSILERMEQLTLILDADWFMHVDADERRRTPWRRTSMRDAVHFVDQCGFNCIDHTVLNFHPIDDRYEGGDVESQLRFFEFGQRPGHFVQRKAWKNLGVRPTRADSGGHNTAFSGQRIYPFKFLLKHYPIRSQAHGQRKVFSERINRFAPLELELGWHVHYDDLRDPHCFLHDPAVLLEFDDDSFDREYLVERLAGIGTQRLSMHTSPGK